MLKATERKYRVDFWLLLVYSLLPGFGKIIHNQGAMLFCVPIILFIIFRKKWTIRINYSESLFMMFFLYVILLSIVYVVFPFGNRLGVFMAIFLDVIPMLGFFYCRRLPFQVFAKILMIICLIHTVIAILLYPPFRIIPLDSHISQSLLEGVAIGRMSSVSGSLGFGNLILVGMVLSFFLNRKFLPVLLIGWVFSAQRSAWVGVILSIIFVTFLGLLNYEVKRSLKILTVIVIGGLLFFVLLSSFLEFNLDFIFSRISGINSASSERVDQWNNGISNFLQVPFGAGPGQIGQVASRYTHSTMGLKVVPDGDYFRIISEYGFGGAIFFVCVFVLLFITAFIFKLSNKERVIMGVLFGCMFQMIGSNITEFYFDNFVFWTFIGYFFNIVHVHMPVKWSFKANSKLNRI